VRFRRISWFNSRVSLAQAVRDTMVHRVATECSLSAMPFRTRPLLFAAVTFWLIVAATGAMAQNDDKSPAVRPADAAASQDEISQFCTNAAPAASEARIAWQTKRLNELDDRIKQRMAELEKVEADARDWVSKREMLLKAATQDVTAIYAKMDPESAATQIGAMDETVAAAILTKLNPRVASAILGEMEAPRASRLTSIMSGVSVDEKRS
jgi:flagellar motility protein MotE (MotC chaperone)